MESPDIPSAEVQQFAFCVGKVIQNFGSIEYLANELIVIFVADAVIASHIVKQGFSKRLDFLEHLISRKQVELNSRGFIVDDLFALTRSTFRERNKITHNPFVLRVTKTNEGARQTAGIHVIRYHVEGQDEEWIEKPHLESMVVTTRDLVGRFNILLELCKP